MTEEEFESNLGKAQEKDEEATEKLLDEALRILHPLDFWSKESAVGPEDIKQIVCLKLWGSIESIENRRHFANLVCKIARDERIDHYRRIEAKKRGVPESVIKTELPGKLTTPSLAAKIKEVLERLSPREQKVVSLIRDERLSTRQIAERLGVNVKTVQRTINKIEEEIRCQMEA